MSKMWQCANLQFLSEKGPIGMGQFWVPESTVGHKWSNFQPFRLKFGLYTLLLGISTWKIKKLHMGQTWALLGNWPLFGAPKVRGLITLDPDVLYICNITGAFCIMKSIMWQCANLQFPSEKGPMGMGQFWVPESAVGLKLSNFQPFRFNFGLCTWFLGISTWKTGNTNLEPICALFGILTFFGAPKLHSLITLKIAL